MTTFIFSTLKQYGVHIQKRSTQEMNEFLLITGKTLEGNLNSFLILMNSDLNGNQERSFRSMEMVVRTNSCDHSVMDGKNKSTIPKIIR